MPAGNGPLGHQALPGRRQIVYQKATLVNSCLMFPSLGVWRLTRWSRLAFVEPREHVTVAPPGASSVAPSKKRQRTGAARRKTPRPVPPDAVPLAEKLNHLFRMARAPEGGEYTMDEVANAIRARGGPPISAAYLSLLRRGKRDNPTREHIAALADFFGVAVTYFFDEPAAARFDAELDLLVSLRDPLVRRIAVQACGLSPESLSAIAAIVEQARRLERLPPAPATSPAADQPEA